MSDGLNKREGGREREINQERKKKKEMNYLQRTANPCSLISFMLRFGQP